MQRLTSLLISMMISGQSSVLPTIIFTAITGQQIPERHTATVTEVDEYFIAGHSLGGFTSADVLFRESTTVPPDQKITENAYIYGVTLVDNVKSSIASQFYNMALSHIKSMLIGSAFKSKAETDFGSTHFAMWDKEKYPPPKPPLGSQWPNIYVLLAKQPSVKGDFKVTLSIAKTLAYF
jgi:hypothetical protein